MDGTTTLDIGGGEKEVELDILKVGRVDISRSSWYTHTPVVCVLLCLRLRHEFVYLRLGFWT